MLSTPIRKHSNKDIMVMNLCHKGMAQNFGQN